MIFLREQLDMVGKIARLAATASQKTSISLHGLHGHFCLSSCGFLGFLRSLHGFGGLGQHIFVARCADKARHPVPVIGATIRGRAQAEILHGCYEKKVCIWLRWIGNDTRDEITTKKSAGQEVHTSHHWILTI